jgi:hypothetical protein
MKWYYKISILIIFCVFGIHAKAQVPDSIPVREDVVGEIITDIYRTKVSSAIEKVNEFASDWDRGGFSTAQKQKIESIYGHFKNRKISANPYLINFVKMVSLAGSNELIQLNVMDDILNVTDKVMENESGVRMHKYYQNLNTFLKFGAIHYSNGYKLMVGNIDITFDYVESAEPVFEETLEEEVIEEYSEEEGLDDWEINEPTDDNWADDWETTDNSTDNWTDDWGSNDNTNTSNDTSGDIVDEWVDSGDDDWGSQSKEITLEDKMLTIDAIVETKLPPENGPVIRLKNADLIFLTNYDSIKLISSNGSLLLSEDMFLGEGGTFNWSSTGLNSQDVYCNLNNYIIDINYPAFKSPKSSMYYEGKIVDPVEGTFEYKSLKRRLGKRSDYPKFTSYRNDIQVYFEGDKNVIYRGGFSMRGNQIWGMSFLGDNAILEGQDEIGLLFRAISKNFQLGDTLITATNAKFTIYQGSDSVYHPSVKLNYNPYNRHLMVYRDNGPYRITPYSSTFFKMNITADMINWDLDEDTLDISIASAKNIIPAYFESKEYFNKEDMSSLSGIYDFNPLMMAVFYARKTRKKEFYAFDMAQAMKQNEKAVSAAMVGLMQNDFINYNQNTGFVQVKDKAFHYVDANRYKTDFDDMKMKSVSPVLPNATLNLEDNSLTIRGIEKFFISEILDVFIIPEKKEITLKSNRDLEFNGQMFAGNFEFIGRDFVFDYDSFLVDLNYIDSIRFYIEDPETGMRRRVGNKLVSADSTADEALAGLSEDLQQSTGRLYINRPENKSGQRHYPSYPKFQADKGAIVYFNNPSILNGAYDESIYFIIPPFEIDSLSDSDPAAIGFNGTFIAQGILPPFEETLHIREDNTLGFEHDIAPEGYELYGGSGRIYNKLTISRKGLTSEGSIKYMSTSMNSDNFTFYLDSLTGDASAFIVEQGEFDGGSFPDVQVDSVRLKWLPKKDSMYVWNQNLPFTLYDNTATLNGLFTVSATGGFGKGTLLTRGAEAISDEFSFNETRFGGRHATFIINSDNPEKAALAGDDIKLDFNLVNNYADIGPEIEGVAAINFPYAQFRTSISNARWYLDDRKVEMQKPPEVDINNSYFYTTREDLDSLVFNATNAVYDIDKLELLVSGIPYINVADAKITPENNEVLVLENAKIGTLYNTNIVIDTLYEFHQLYNGTIDIISRNKFEGRATYRYVNAVDDTFAIQIDEFYLVAENSRNRDSDLHTQATGYVYEDDGVIISPGMSYKGEAIMYAPDPAFKLDGYVKLQFTTGDYDDIWIKYQNSGESQEVIFDFNNAVTENETELIAGLFYDEDDRLYSSFISPKRSFLDNAFFLPHGILSYDPDSTTYRIEDSLKINGDSYSGRIFNQNVNTGDIQFEGPVNFNMLTDDLELTGAAIGSGNINEEIFQLNGFLTLDFKMPSQAMSLISQEMIEIVDVLGLEMAYSDDPNTLYKVSEIIGERATLEYEQRSLQEYTSLLSISSKLLKTLVLSDVNLRWSKEDKAWYSVGRIGLGNILQDDINASVDGFLEIKKNENGDVINLFLQFSPRTWYYFNFEENRIITSSSNEDYLNAIADKTNASKANFGEYFFLDGELSDALKFVDNFRLTYFNIDEPYEIEFAPSQDILPMFEEEEEETDDGFTIPEEVEEEEEDDDGF